MDLPELSKKDLEEAMADVARREKQGRRLFAFHGRYEPGVCEELNIAGSERFLVAPVRSELDLRGQMPAIGATSMPIAFVVPWSGEVPLDLAGRFSRNGRIKRIGKESRLKRLLNATELGDGVLGSPLAEHLLTHPDALGAAPSLGGFVTLDALFDRWLQARFGIDTSGGVALDLLLGWAAIDTRAGQADELEARDPPLARAIEAHLSRTLRDAGLVVWNAWRKRRGRGLLELAVLFEALASHDDGPAFTWRGMQHAELGVADPVVAGRIAIELGEAVGRALRWVEERESGATRSVLLTAEAKVTAVDVRPLLVSSKRLPLAWDLRLEALGRALTAGADSPTPEALDRAANARAQLETHAAFSDAKHGAVVRRAERAVQLLAWLASGQAAPEAATETPFKDAEVLGRWYVEEGGFVDLARRGARGPVGDAFGVGVQAVVTAADRLRQALDRRFARALAGWIEAGRPNAQVLPIDQAVERVALRYLNDEPTRKLLIVLMDGMAWSQAMSILSSLGDWSVPWGPIAWHASAKGRIGLSARPVVFAQVPTVTEVSRAAFFAGRPTPAGAAQTTADDPKRWLANKAVGKVEPEGIEPRLLLRGEGHTNAGVASQEALSLVADPKRRLVGIVINAIDASLKGDTQQRHDWVADSIGSFVELLDKARESGRAVLLAADHGHVPGDLLVSKGSFTGASPRFRPWSDPSDPIAEDEVGIPASAGVWAPKGAHGVILLADEHARYGGGAHAGEHGGASLAEVVAPCLLIAPDDGRDVHDADQKVMPLMVPAWWHLDVEVPPDATANVPDEPVAPRKPPKKGKQPPKEQLPFVALAAFVAPPAPAAEAPTPRKTPASGTAAPSPLEANELFLARTTNDDERKRVVAAVSYLRERGDSAHLDAFCAAMGTPSWRAPGLVRTLQQVLNVDGYEALTHDLKAKQIRLERAVLEAQFGVKL